MAQAKDNIITKGLSGTVAKTITFRQRAGKTIVGKARRGNSGLPTDKALAVRARFTASIAYGKIAIKDPATKALYKAAAGPDQSAFNVAFRDAFTPPKVESIDASAYHGIVGDTLTIRATDDFKVTGVTVSIRDVVGALIEQGTATVQQNGADWMYKSTQSNATIAGSKITALAKDLPGNSGSLEITL